MKVTAAALVFALALPVLPARAAMDLPDPFGTSTPEPAQPAPSPAPEPVPAGAAPPPAASKHDDHARHGGYVRRNVAVPARLRAKKTAKQAPKPPVNQLKVAEKIGFKKVSDLVNFPPFFPGLGIVTVKPDTLPVGPFRTFDRKGKLVSTVYMLPLKDMDDHKKWDEVKGLPAPADHATFYYHPGHAGVDMPHYHLVIWHVTRKDEALVAK